VTGLAHRTFGDKRSFFFKSGDFERNRVNWRNIFVYFSELIDFRRFRLK